MTAAPAQFGVRAETNDDLTLVQASKNGDVAAFEQLVKRYDRKLFRIAQSVTHNREDSQDAVQEALLKAYQHLGDFRGDSQFSTWLIRITLNQSLMKLRKLRRTKEVALDEDFGTDEDVLPREVIDWAPNPEQLYSVSELRNILIKTIEELRPILRAVFVLQDLEGLSTDQTAEVLNLSQSAVKSRLWRARLELRERLNKYFGKSAESAQVESTLYKRLAQAAPHSHRLVADQQGGTGHIRSEMLITQVGIVRGPIYYTTGPPTMVEATRRTLSAAGVDKDDIRTEEFAGY